MLLPVVQKWLILCHLEPLWFPQVQLSGEAASAYDKAVKTILPVLSSSFFEKVQNKDWERWLPLGHILYYDKIGLY